MIHLAVQIQEARLGKDCTAVFSQGDSEIHEKRSSFYFEKHYHIHYLQSVTEVRYVSYY